MKTRNGKFAHLIWVLLCVPVLAVEVFSQAEFQLGVNFDGQNTGAFVNLALHSHRYSKVTAYDSLGYPMSDFDYLLMDARPVAEWSKTIDDPEKYRVNMSGTYACSFRGQAQVSSPWVASSIQNMQYDAATNTSRFELVVGGYPGADHGLVNLVFTNTRRSSSDTLRSGITDLVINRPGYPLGSSKVFTDEFLALCRAADFACYRFYGVQNVWDSEPVYPAKTRWSERKPANYASQVPVTETAKIDGWSWEHMIMLANILKKDIWICVLMSADSDYVTQLAHLLKTELDPSINVYVENSNEVWSPTFHAYGVYNQADAKARSLSFDQNYARRTVELSQLFAQVFGAEQINKRIRVVLGSQQGYVGRTDVHTSFIQSHFGPPSTYIYALNPSLYFGSSTESNSDEVVVAQGMHTDIERQLSDKSYALYREPHLERARKLGLVGGCVSYEGGPGVPSSLNNNLSAQIRAHRTKECADAIRFNYLQGWKEKGGGLANFFTLASSYNRYGCWGATDDYKNPDRNYKMQALRDIIAASQSTPVLEQDGDRSREAGRTYVQPSPCDERCHFRFVLSGVRENQEVCVVIRDALGRILHRQRHELRDGMVEGTFETTELSTGLYCIECISDTAAVVSSHAIVVAHP